MSAASILELDDALAENAENRLRNERESDKDSELDDLLSDISDTDFKTIYM